jgi:hypothetical protein
MASKSSATGTPFGLRLSSTCVLIMVVNVLGTNYGACNLSCALSFGHGQYRLNKKADASHYQAGVIEVIDC